MNRLSSLLVAMLALSVADCATAGRPESTTPPSEGDTFSMASLSVARNPPPELDARLFLVGDAGAARPGDPVLAAIEMMAGEAPDRSTLFFLGDNLYPDGLDSLGSPARASDEARLRFLASVGHDKGIRRVFIPGNHDWNDSHAGGWQAVVDQQEFVDGLGLEGLSYLPKGGCPGPSFVDLRNTLRVVILDTEWWLDGFTKAGPENSDCEYATQTEVMRALDEVLQAAGSRRVVVAAHHPLNSGGPHGGYLGWRDHVFPLRRIARWAWLPLPGVGSLYPLVRTLVASPQDLNSPQYRAMTDSLERVFRRHDVVAYVGGHDHNLQVLRDDVVRFALVSGAGPSTGVTPPAWISATEYARGAPGFMRLDVFADRSVKLSVFATDGYGTISEEFARWLISDRDVRRYTNQ